jgi:hypothetical protein
MSTYHIVIIAILSMVAFYFAGFRQKRAMWEAWDDGKSVGFLIGK